MQKGRRNRLPFSVCASIMQLCPTQDKVQVSQTAENRILNSSSAFSFAYAGAKEKAIKKKTPSRDFALCGARQELRALDGAAFPKRRAKTLLRVEIFVSEIFGLPFLAIHQNGLDKNAQSRRISVSSPYNRTAETDFGERKSEYNKNAGNPRADFLPSLKSILVKV